jgi:hypothetical protein
VTGAGIGAEVASLVGRMSFVIIAIHLPTEFESNMLDSRQGISEEKRQQVDERLGTITEAKGSWSLFTKKAKDNACTSAQDYLSNYGKFSVVPTLYSMSYCPSRTQQP